MSYLNKTTYKDKTYYSSEYNQGDPNTDKAIQLFFKSFDEDINDVLFINFGCGSIIPVLKNFVDNACFVHDSFIDDGACKKNIDLHGLKYQSHVTCVEQLNHLPHKHVFIKLNKHKQWNNFILSYVYHHTDEDVLIYVLGSNDVGVKSFQKYMEKECGFFPEVMWNGASSRLLAIEKEEQESSNEIVLENIEYEFLGKKFSLNAHPGVFSQKKLDFGSEFLIQSLPDLSGKRVLDFGCGAGVLSIAAYEKGAREVHSIDNSIAAVQNTEANLKKNGYATNVYCTFLTDDVDQKFDVIITNPPFHVGKSTVFNFGRLWLANCKNVLNEGGKVILVANEFLKYREFIPEYFSEYTIIRKGCGFLVYSIV